MKRIVVVCDNTMGIPGKPVDDGLALLYLLGLDRVQIEGICCTHGNATIAETYEATKRLVASWGLDIPVFRGADTGSAEISEAARFIAEAPNLGEGVDLLSLGATTDLAQAELLSPGCLSRYSHVALMGGITHTLVVGGVVMNELNFSVDGAATSAVFATANQGADILLADAWNCLPLTFLTDDFKQRLIDPAHALADQLAQLCLPWMERARVEWNTDGFVGWDVLPAVALARPSLVQTTPFSVACNARLLSVGYLEETDCAGLAAPIALVAPRDASQLCEHIYQAWETASSMLV